MNVNDVISRLPPYSGLEEVIREDQTVKDIIKEVLFSHNYFASDYNHVYYLFDAGNTADTCKNLFSFCKKNIAYVIESEDDQTTRSPAATLEIGSGDCKHYAGFIAGVLDAINRHGGNIDWKYRFASYNLFNSEPGHVFVVVNDEGEELWIDPVLSEFNERYEPFFITDRKPKMLTRVSGIQFSPDLQLSTEVLHARDMALAGIGSTVTAYPGQEIQRFGPLFGPLFAPYLGLSFYDNTGNSSGTNWDALANSINQQISAGPYPGHTYNGDFVKWVFDNKIKNWNFYFPHGVKPGFDPRQQLIAFDPNYPLLVMTPDGRLSFDHMHKIADNADSYDTFAVTAWAQDLINRFGDGHPIKPHQMVEYSQGKHGNENTMNIFEEIRGTSIFHDVGKALEDSVNFVKDGVLKITGSPLRNAFLALIGINAFGWATKMKKHIDAGEWPEMARKWESVGGNPDKLKNTIEDNASKPAILGSVAVGAAIGVAQAAGWLAAAAPIIALLLKYLDKDGKATEVVNAMIPQLSEQFPDIDFSPLRDALPARSITTGQPISWIVDDADNENKGGGTNELPGSKSAFSNPILLAAIAGGALYFLSTSKSRKKKVSGIGNKLLPIGIGVGLIYLATKKSNQGLPTSEKIKYISIYTNGEIDNILSQMTVAEIDDSYTYIKDYVSKGIQVPAGDFHDRLAAISIKYNIFE